MPNFALYQTVCGMRVQIFYFLQLKIDLIRHLNSLLHPSTQDFHSKWHLLGSQGAPKSSHPDLSHQTQDNPRLCLETCWRLTGLLARRI